jgi:hypothetical protein
LAVDQNIQVRDLACTFLAAVIFETHSLFLQIGDGAIVLHGANGYEPVFWPQSGEYLNTTNFLTDADFHNKLMIRVINECVEEFALFTDGIERLALRMSDCTAYEPFFRPLFESLRAASSADALFEPLRQFLDSDRMNERTDDDKTLILATRRLAGQHTDAAIL